MQREIIQLKNQLSQSNSGSAVQVLQNKLSEERNKIADLVRENN